MSFNSLPVIDLNQAFDADTKNNFMNDLRHALVEVGFFILINFEQHGPSQHDLKNIEEQAVSFFALPKHFKEEVAMINSPHFLGYTDVGKEITSGRVDLREQIDLATELPAPSKTLPLYHQVEGPNLWPNAEVLPRFRPAITEFIEKMTALSVTMRGLVAQAIGLPQNGLDTFFRENQQYKMKLVSYPDSQEHSDEESANFRQGVGAHRDNTFMTFIYQAIEIEGSLQVENFEGKWVPVTKTPNSLVVNVGQLLENITNGICKATIHRVVSPKKGSGGRLSIPFFQTVDTNAYQEKLADFSPEVLLLRDERDQQLTSWGRNVGFQFTPDLTKTPAGYSVFKNRIKSHQDVAERWYPEELREVLAQI
ncbi:unnamed protein product [Kluyveromyces dobzhanskii CBS 2104]|uniref:WGS project CCBQ000000000 data, contig 00104 n=1 Tax=Kluyveromyces dobzhanskii CBS 2104 TaxID=1427455 RepID=A0A0A8L5N6_9SACH|nr:unnamed protein product [Kluyveromyces dobzhanskii CBS 2104]